jgi:hypothetical protein
MSSASIGLDPAAESGVILKHVIVRLKRRRAASRWAGTLLQGKHRQSAAEMRTGCSQRCSEGEVAEVQHSSWRSRRKEEFRRNFVQFAMSSDGAKVACLEYAQICCGCGVRRHAVERSCHGL